MIIEGEPFTAGATVAQAIEVLGDRWQADKDDLLCDLALADISRIIVTGKYGKAVQERDHRRKEAERLAAENAAVHSWAKAWKAAARKNRIQAQTWQALAVIAEGVGQQLARENAALLARCNASEQRILALQRLIAEREIEAAGVEARPTP